MKESDPITVFLEECCVESEDQEVRAGQLYNAFREWMKGQRGIPSQVVFGRRMSQKFGKKEKASGYYYQGIALRGAKLVGTRLTGITIDPDEIEEDS